MTRRTRRRYLTALAVGSVALAGCSGDSGDGADDATDAADDGNSADSATDTAETSGTASETDETGAGTSDISAAPVGDWPTSQRDAGNTGAAAGVDLTEGVEQAWGTGGSVIGPVVRDGTAYVSLLGSGALRAVDVATGDEVWAREQVSDGNDLPLAARSIPAVGNGTVVVGTGGGYRAFDAADGTTAWQGESLDFSAVAPTVHEGTIYYSTSSAHYAAAIEDGSEQWRYEATGGATPAIHDGTVFTSTVTDDGTQQVLALDAADGTVVWTTQRPVNTITAVDGTVYVSASTEHDDDRYADGTVFALDAATGEERWTVEFDYETRPSIAVAGGTAYVGENVHLYALDTADGSERWRFDMQQYGRDPSPATVVGDTVCFTNGRGRLFALDAATGAERWTVDAPGEPSGDVVVTEGMLLAGGAGGLRAFSLP